MSPKKYLITGLGGSLAPRLAAAARNQGCEIVGWNRSEVDPENSAACWAFLEAVRPDAIFHLALGSAGWSARLSRYAADHAIPFVYTSSAMVFNNEPPGPHRIDSARTAKDGYGQYKMASEDAILKENPAAIVARIGWQIDPTQAGNNMLMALDQWQIRDGDVAASRVWIPACSFMDDTADALLALVQQQSLRGVVHLDSNASEGHSFVALVRALKQRFSRGDWVVREHEDYRHDQRLIGGEKLIPPLSKRLSF